MSKKTISYIVVLVLIISLTQVQVSANSECSTCSFSGVEKVSNYYDDEGNYVEVFDDGIEVVYYENGDIIIKDYKHLYDEYFDLNPNQRIDWIKIAQVLWTIAGGCSTIMYIAHGEDVCGIVLDYLKENIKFGVYYTLSGNFVSGYIPGCEPMHSAPCNAGYWQYKVTQ